jgi:hypothetical protein
VGLQAGDGRVQVGDREREMPQPARLPGNSDAPAGPGG